MNNCGGARVHPQRDNDDEDDGVCPKERAVMTELLRFYGDAFFRNDQLSDDESRMRQAELQGRLDELNRIEAQEQASQYDFKFGYARLAQALQNRIDELVWVDKYTPVDIADIPEVEDNGEDQSEERAVQTELLTYYNDAYQRNDMLDGDAALQRLEQLKTRMQDLMRLKTEKNTCQYHFKFGSCRLKEALQHRIDELEWVKSQPSGNRRDSSGDGFGEISFHGISNTMDPDTEINEIFERKNVLLNNMVELLTIINTEPSHNSSCQLIEAHHMKQVELMREKIDVLEERYKILDLERRAQEYVRDIKSFFDDAFGEETVTQPQDVVARVNELKCQHGKLSAIISAEPHGAAAKMPRDFQPKCVYRAICEKIRALEMKVKEFGMIRSRRDLRC